MDDQPTRDEILALSSQLIELRSTEDNIAAQQSCIDLIANAFQADFHLTRHEFGGHPALVLSTTHEQTVRAAISGHIDVVPAPDALFTPRVHGTRLLGRGAYDMKAALVACIIAARDYRTHGGLRDIAVYITSDEEVCGQGTEQLLAAGYTTPFVFIPDGGTDTHLVIEQKGVAFFQIELDGTSVHASRPWEGKNPIDRIEEVRSALQKAFPTPTAREPWKTSATITQISTEGSVNQISCRASLSVDVRYVAPADLRQVAHVMKRAVGRHGRVRIVSEHGLFTVDERNPYVQKFASAVHDVTRKRISFISENGASDAIYFSERGIPAVLSRPIGGAAHEQGEWVDIESLSTMHHALLTFFRSLT